MQENVNPFAAPQPVQSARNVHRETVMSNKLGYVGILLGALIGAPASAQEVALSFTAAQVEQGRAVYDTTCVMCHGANFDDGPLAAPLKGDAFMRKYGGKPARALFDVLRTTMPTGNPGSLSADTYAALAALILAQNDIVAGAARAAVGSGSRSRAMQVPAGGFSFMAFSPYTARPAVDRPTPLASFNAVTDDAIAAPPAGDWLGWRRSYDAQGFSPLARDRHAQRREPARSRGAGRCRAGSDRERAARARRHDLRASVRRHRAGARRAHRRSALAVHARARARRVAVSQARPRALRQSALPRHVGRARRRARRRDRRGRVGHDDRRLSPPRRLERRPARRARQGHDRHDRHRRRGAASAGRRSSGSTPRPARSRGALDTIAKPGEPGGDSWNGIPFEQRSGASIWTPGSYDPATGLAYFGTGNTYDTGPLLQAERARARRTTRCTRTRRSRSNPDTGALVWHFQHFPNDQWDLDWAFERQIMRLARQRRDAPRRADGRQDRHLRRRRRRARASSCSRSISA